MNAEDVLNLKLDDLWKIEKQKKSKGMRDNVQRTSYLEQFEFSE